jgi:signal transduction histidine kinase
VTTSEEFKDLFENAISAGARILQRSGALKDQKELRVLDMINTTVTRRSDLIDDILDFARGRLGTGITLNRDISPWNNNSVGPGGRRHKG